MAMHLMAIHPIGVYYMGVHFIGVSFIDVHLMGVYLINVPLLACFLYAYISSFGGRWPGVAFLILALSGNLTLGPITPGI
jgi:hypothetical protein